MRRSSPTGAPLGRHRLARADRGDHHRHERERIGAARERVGVVRSPAPPDRAGHSSRMRCQRGSNAVLACSPAADFEAMRPVASV